MKTTLEIREKAKEKMEFLPAGRAEDLPEKLVRILGTCSPLHCSEEVYF